MPTHVVIPRRTLVFVFVVALLALLAFLAYIYLPKATIAVSPRTFDRSVDQVITLSSETKEPDFAHFILPSKMLDKTIEITHQVSRTSGNIKSDFAKGTVVLHNNQDEEQPLLPNTHLRHEESGVFFVTNNAVRIPPQGTTEVEVTAEAEGASGNVKAGKFIIDKLPVNLQSLVYGESSTDFSGGESIDTPLSASELAQSKKEAEEKAQKEAEDQLILLSRGIALRKDLITFTNEEEKSSADIGSKATTYQIYIRTRVRAFTVDDNDLLSLTLLSLRALPGDDEEFLSYNPNSFELKLNRSDFDRGIAQVTCNLSGVFAKKIEPSILNSNNLAGRTAKEITEYFKGFDSVGNVAIEFSPFWVSTAPGRPGAIVTTIKNPN